MFPQHLIFLALQLQLRVQQVSIQHILGIQTLQHIPCRCPVSQARIYCNISFKFRSENMQWGIPTTDEEESFNIVYAFAYFENFRADILMYYPDIRVYVCRSILYFSLVQLFVFLVQFPFRLH